MALTSTDIADVRALWDEWVTDGFELSVEVRADPGVPEIVASVDVQDPRAAATVNARLTPSYYCQVQIRCGERLVFDERVPHDARALHASVGALARQVALHQAQLADRDREQ